MNCSTKVGGEPSIIVRLRTVFVRAHSSNVATGARSVPLSLSKLDSYDDEAVWGAPCDIVLLVWEFLRPTRTVHCRDEASKGRPEAVAASPRTSFPDRNTIHGYLQTGCLAIYGESRLSSAAPTRIWYLIFLASDGWNGWCWTHQHFGKDEATAVTIDSSLYPVYPRLQRTQVA